MAQVAVPAAFYRGGTSRAIMFREADLEQYRDDEVCAILLAALGSPDPYGREVDGLGGGISSLSKAAIVGPARADSGADVTFRFAQIDVEQPLVEFLGTCGNISAAVGPFAIEEGMVPAVEPLTTVSVLSVNTGQRYLCYVPVRDGRPEVEGDFAIDGVPAPGALIALEFQEPGGSLGRGVLPTGRSTESVVLSDGRCYQVSIVDAANPMVFVRASDLGASATELPQEIDDDVGLRDALEQIRDHAAVRLGLAATASEAHDHARSIPKVVMVAPPVDYTTTRGSAMPSSAIDLSTRMLSVGKTHRTIAGTTAICTAVAAALEGTIVNQVVQPAGMATRDRTERVVRIGHPAGSLEIGVSAERSDDGWTVRSVTTYRTARRIMAGEIYVPPSYLSGGAWYERESAVRAPVGVAVG